MELPEKVLFIINRLEDAGFEAYAVGGCVRDVLLGVKPKDWDITTSAKPQEVKKLFRRTIDTGIQHGTVTIMLDKDGFEVTTYRLDGKYSDGRHPESVTFTPSLEEDLKRRDFTINAMAYNDRAGVVDLFGGQEDLKNGIIRCVGNPVDRFTEDGLRMLRAIRFSAVLGFEISPDVIDAITSLSSRIALVSAERIKVELEKTIMSAHPERIELVSTTGLAAHFLPELDEMFATPQRGGNHYGNVGVHTVDVMRYTPAVAHLRWTALLHDVGKPSVREVDAAGHDHFNHHGEPGAVIAEKICRRLKFDRATQDKIVKLIRWHDYPFRVNKVDVRHVMNGIGPDLFEDLLIIAKADNMAKKKEPSEFLLNALAQVEVLYREIVADGDAVTLKQLAINGGDLMKAGITAGKNMGTILNALLEEVMQDPARNNREYLLARADELYKELFSNLN